MFLNHFEYNYITYISLVVCVSLKSILCLLLFHYTIISHSALVGLLPVLVNDITLCVVVPHLLARDSPLPTNVYIKIQYHSK